MKKVFLILFLFVLLLIVGVVVFIATFDIESYSVFNARISLGAQDQGWNIALIGKNLTDDESLDIAADLRGLLGTVITSYRAPRTYGGEFSCRF